MLKNAEARPARDTSTMETHAIETGLKQKSKNWMQRHQARRQVLPRDMSKTPTQSQSHPQSRSQPRHQHRNQHSKGHSSDSHHRTNESFLTCHRCCQTGHIVQNYRSSQYVVNIYKELQDLKSKSTPREAHSLDISDLDPKLENYLVSTSRLAPDSPDTALLDSATIHSILRHPNYFQFKHSDFP